MSHSQIFLIDLAGGEKNIIPVVKFTGKHARNSRYEDELSKFIWQVYGDRENLEFVLSQLDKEFLFERNHGKFSTVDYGIYKETRDDRELFEELSEEYRDNPDFKYLFDIGVNHYYGYTDCNVVKIGVDHLNNISFSIGSLDDSFLALNWSNLSEFDAKLLIESLINHLRNTPVISQYSVSKEIIRINIPPTFGQTN
jgi:hypothetical protein